MHSFFGVGIQERSRIYSKQCNDRPQQCDVWEGAGLSAKKKLSNNNETIYVHCVFECVSGVGHSTEWVTFIE